MKYLYKPRDFYNVDDYIRNRITPTKLRRKMAKNQETWSMIGALNECRKHKKLNLNRYYKISFKKVSLTEKEKAKIIKEIKKEVASSIIKKGFCEEYRNNLITKLQETQIAKEVAEKIYKTANPYNIEVEIKEIL